MITIDRICKRYGAITAVNDLSFSVQEGTICGLLGPNGAGKSTTMNIMTGCLAATSGEVRYDGQEIYTNRNTVKKSIGYLPEQPPLYPEMTAFEYLCFVGRAKGLSEGEAYQEAKKLGASCGLNGIENRLIKNVSKGYRQRIGIAQALIGSPKTVILDEPTVGLDPVQIIEIRNLIRQLGEKRTIVVSSHILSEIRALCHQIVVVSKGRLVADDTPERLERRFSGPSTTSVTARADELSARNAILDIPWVEDVEITDAPYDDDAIEIRLTIAESKDVREHVFHAFASRDLPILAMSTKRASFEDVFIELTQASPAPIDESANSGEQTKDEEVFSEEKSPGDKDESADRPAFGDSPRSRATTPDDASARFAHDERSERGGQ